MKHRLVQLIYLLLPLILLISCASPVNKPNFDRIRPDMTLNEVTAILGKPSHSTSLSFGNVDGITAEWRSRNGTILIHFFNGRVKLKQFIHGVSTPRKE